MEYNDEMIDSDLDLDIDLDKKEVEIEERPKRRKKKNKKNKLIKELTEYALCILIAFVVALLIRKYVMVIGYVPTTSMYDTINKGDRLIINELAYVFGEPKRGDIVSFYYPDDESQVYIKRIIGLPGETIEGKDGAVYINGTRLNESSYIDDVYTSDFGPYLIPENSYFMMGDNRSNSRDSRFWDNKYVSIDKIIGRSVLRIYPTIGKLEKAIYD